jgi:hypothetical protein
MTLVRYPWIWLPGVIVFGVLPNIFVRALVAAMRW